MIGFDVTVNRFTEHALADHDLCQFIYREPIFNDVSLGCYLNFQIILIKQVNI